MDSTVLAAIIGAIATIIVAVIAAKVKTKKPAQEHDDYSRVEDDVTGKGKKSEQGHDDYSVKVEGNVTGSVVGGSRNIVTMITQGVSKHEFNHAQSNDYVERGRERVRAYAERITRTGEWDWNPLGHAIEYYVDAIRYDPQNQHAWINLAYLYHIIGDRKSALECMQRALELATPGPNYPGRHYKQVKAAIDGDCYLSGVAIDRPSMSDWFRQKYEQFLPPRRES